MVIYDERPAANLPGIVRVHFPVRVHRSGNVATTVRTQQDAIFSAILRNRPHGRDAGRVYLDVIDATGLGVASSRSVRNPLSALGAN
jgi:hypothetical protein